MYTYVSITLRFLLDHGILSGICMLQDLVSVLLYKVLVIYDVRKPIPDLTWWFNGYPRTGR